MTTDEKLIKIAEACGWIPCTPADLTLSEKLTYGDNWWRRPEDRTIACLANLPDYFNDLNACYEMEEFIPSSLKLRYTLNLTDITDDFFGLKQEQPHNNAPKHSAKPSIFGNNYDDDAQRFKPAQSHGPRLPVVLQTRLSNPLPARRDIAPTPRNPRCPLLRAS